MVGLATAKAVMDRSPRTRVTVLEKEPRLAAHQTGHNSGVIHSGVYYRPGSLKARLCVAGAQAMTAFCRAQAIPYQRCGKLIVAVDTGELPRLDELARRGRANGVPDLALIEQDRLREIEPEVVGLRALHVPSAAIVDYQRVADALARTIRDRGADVRLSTRVVGILRRADGLVVQTTAGDLPATCVVNCAGLQADRLARWSRTAVPLRIVPFRGEYYELTPARRHLVRGLVYPVPDPRLPFLGVHLSRTIDGRVEVGPNAVLALKREGYRKHDVSVTDMAEMFAFPGFWRMVLQRWRYGLGELYRSWSKAAFLRSVQRLMPAITAEDLVPAKTGVRAQAIDDHGALLDDFSVLGDDRVIHVCNAPSPAATASLTIGEAIAGRALPCLK